MKFRSNKCMSLKFQGNEQFGHGFWSEAAQLYKKALDTCPLQYGCDRSV